MSSQDENSNEDVLASTSSTTSVDNSKQKVKEKPIVKANSKRRERKRVEKEKKRGIIYLARIPRDVQPAQIRQLLKEHAESEFGGFFSFLKFCVVIFPFYFFSLLPDTFFFVT